jgi:hypothetical protein
MFKVHYLLIEPVPRDLDPLVSFHATGSAADCDVSDLLDETID